MAVVSFVVVGVGPRTIGRQHAYSVGRFSAPLVLWLGRALGPLATLLIRIGNAFTPGKGFKQGPFATQVELRELIDLAEQRGVVEHFQQRRQRAELPSRRDEREDSAPTPGDFSECQQPFVGSGTAHHQHRRV